VSSEFVRLPGILFIGAVCAMFATSGAAQDSEEALGGILSTTLGDFTFTPKVCAIYLRDDEPDIEIGGPGTSPDGEDLYFELSSTANALSVSLGADSAFQSSNRKLKAGRFDSTEFTLEVRDDTITARELQLVDQDGATVDAAAQLHINCASG